jgi:hypothetical protein
MSEPTPTPDQSELLKQARRHNLLRIWASGSRRLSAEEKVEIADMIGNSGNTGPAHGFSLDPNAPLPAKLRNYYKCTYVDYATGSNGAPNYQNSKDGRTVKRWVSCGRNSKPPDLPPLDDPGSMAAWFRRAYPKEPVPPVLLNYESVAPSIPAKPQEAPSAVGAPPVVEERRMTAIHFDDLVIGEGQAVRRARKIEEASGQQVEEAYSKGDLGAANTWLPKWKEAANLLRQLEKEDREARKSAGELIDRAPVLAELAQIVEVLRIMRDTMPDKLVSELEKSANRRVRRIVQLLKPHLRAAALRVRESETAIFLNVESLQSPAAVPVKAAA